MNKVRPFRLLVLAAALPLTACSDGRQNREPPSFADPGLQQGRSLWMQVCRNCHLSGVAGAPAIDDRSQWEARLAKSRAELYAGAIRGIQGPDGWRMPPRGGNDALSDAEVRLAVDFMLAAVRQLHDAPDR